MSQNRRWREDSGTPCICTAYIIIVKGEQMKNDALLKWQHGTLRKHSNRVTGVTRCLVRRNGFSM